VKDRFTKPNVMVKVSMPADFSHLLARGMQKKILQRSLQD
jgi:hypothetical protein